MTGIYFRSNDIGRTGSQLGENSICFLEEGNGGGICGTLEPWLLTDGFLLVLEGGELGLDGLGLGLDVLLDFVVFIALKRLEHLFVANNAGELAVLQLLGHLGVLVGKVVDVLDGMTLDTKGIGNEISIITGDENLGLNLLGLGVIVDLDGLGVLAFRGILTLVLENLSKRLYRGGIEE